MAHFLCAKQQYFRVDDLFFFFSENATVLFGVCAEHFWCMVSFALSKYDANKQSDIFARFIYLRHS